MRLQRRAGLRRSASPEKALQAIISKFTGNWPTTVP
jgi:hypothetical protein